MADTNIVQEVGNTMKEAYMTADATQINVLTGISEGVVRSGELLFDGFLALDFLTEYPLHVAKDCILNTNNAPELRDKVHAIIKENKTKALYSKLYDTVIMSKIDDKALKFFKRNEGGDDAALGYKVSEEAGKIAVDAAVAAIPGAGEVIAPIMVGMEGAGSSVEKSLNNMTEEQLHDTKEIVKADAKGAVAGTIDGAVSYLVRSDKLDEVKQNIPIIGKTLTKDGVEQLGESNEVLDFIKSIVENDDLKEFASKLKDKTPEELQTIAAYILKEIEIHDKSFRESALLKEKLEYISELMKSDLSYVDKFNELESLVSTEEEYHEEIDTVKTR